MQVGFFIYWKTETISYISRDPQTTAVSFHGLSRDMDFAESKFRDLMYVICDLRARQYEWFTLEMSCTFNRNLIQ